MVVVVSKLALSVGAGTTSADQVSGTYQFVPKGVIRLFGRGSATGLTFSLLNNGLAIANQQAISSFGTTGTLSKADHLQVEQAVNPGRMELYYQNATGGALTIDFVLEHIATK